MRDWLSILRFVRDNITLILFIVVAGIFGAAWIVFEAIRSHQSRDEVFSLKRRLGQLERERAIGYRVSTDPVVLSTRWVRTGGAATTSDGGCLIYIQKVSPAQSTAILTLRVDGYAVLKDHRIHVGERLEASGKSGTYILDVYAVEGIEASVGIALR